MLKENTRKTVYEEFDTYNIDELNKSKSEGHVDSVCHVLHRSDEFVVASEQISNQPLLIFASTYCKDKHKYNQLLERKSCLSHTFLLSKEPLQ